MCVGGGHYVCETNHACVLLAESILLHIRILFTNCLTNDICFH